jgi:general secretion pathway protein N
MPVLAAFKRSGQGLSRGFESTSRWLDSTLEVARWENMLQAGRRWGWWGGALGALAGLTLFAPASWLADAVAQSSGGRVLLAEAEGTIWTGNAVAVLTGGPGSRDARALPGRLGWQFRTQGLGLKLSLTQDCCLPTPLTLLVKPGWKRVSAELVSTAPAGATVGQWPASWLSGLGAPWNTLQLSGSLKLQTQGLRVEWAQGRTQVAGSAQIVLQDAASRVTTLDHLGTYRLSLVGQAQGQVGIDLHTDEGALQLSGAGQMGPTGLQFRGEATASDAERGALNNLLNIIGRRVGDRSVISIG